MTLNEFENIFKPLVDKWKASYMENHEKDPENWPLDVDFPYFYEDFTLWMELTGERL
ncbi:hypothetical protein Hena1_00240 [Erwinia phage Hena1]|uniref:Uncharacterized protein n=1 Tax=Erwinia phage Hena1 TaxID=2678601 RepID=A0A6B9J5F5_9CAUD|nr:hypothetical protein HWC84_gp023 [Erwinia phage Hena1]QGZ16200.1 hypothetical protein Hena1_00240 [Erwinia phage Hena1]